MTQTAPTPSKEILTRQETQRLLGISKPTFFRWRDLGLIRTAKVQGRIFVRRQDLLDLVDAHMGQPGALAEAA